MFFNPKIGLVHFFPLDIPKIWTRNA
jgi:hypothetical protein